MNALFACVLVVSCTERNAQQRRPAAVAEKTSVVFDSVGDAKKGAQRYQDIVRAEVTKEDRHFVFVEELAAPMPKNLPVPPGVDVLVWIIGVDTDSTGSPPGYPYPEGTAVDWEWFIEIRRYRPGFTDPLDSTGSAGILIDRRPLLTGRPATITPVKFSIDGPTITWVIDAALLGDPPRFQWASGTVLAEARDDARRGYNHIEILDAAPNVPRGEPPAKWPP